MGRILQIICGCVLALALCGLQQPHQASEKEKAQSSQVTTARSPLPVIPPHAHPEMDDPGCAQGEEDRQSDLCAQWYAADAASSAADAAWWLGAIGIFVGGMTLAAAWRAARWAKEAAKETKRSADIADTALQATTRPWLSLEPRIAGDATWDNGTLTVRFQIARANHGSGPAVAGSTTIDRRTGDWRAGPDPYFDYQCAQLRLWPSDRFVRYPDRSPEVGDVIELAFTPEMIAESRARREAYHPGVNLPDTITPQVFLGLPYQAVSGEPTYITALLFEVRKRAPGLGISLRVGENVPARDLELRLSHGGQRTT